MKRFTKKAAAAAVVFSAALNFNGCGVYGPPVDDGEEPQVPYGYVANGSSADDESTSSDNVVSVEATAESAETEESSDTAEQEE